MKRFRILIALAIMAVLVAVTGYFGTHREPTYQGVALSEWLREAQATVIKHGNSKEADSDPVLVSCKVAIREMGSQCVPFLVRDLQASNSKFDGKLVGLTRRPKVARVLPTKTVLWAQNRMVADMIQTTLRHRRAILAFEVLGRNAESGDAALIRLTENADFEKRFWGFTALAASQPPQETFLPVATRLLKDPNQSMQLAVATQIIKLFPAEAERLNLFDTYPQLRYLRAQPATP